MKCNSTRCDASFPGGLKADEFPWHRRLGTQSVTFRACVYQSCGKCCELSFELQPPSHIISFWALITTFSLAQLIRTLTLVIFIVDSGAGMPILALYVSQEWRDGHGLIIKGAKSWLNIALTAPWPAVLTIVWILTDLQYCISPNWGYTTNPLHPLNSYHQLPPLCRPPALSVKATFSSIIRFIAAEVKKS